MRKKSRLRPYNHLLDIYGGKQHWCPSGVNQYSIILFNIRYIVGKRRKDLPFSVACQHYDVKRNCTVEQMVCRDNVDTLSEAKKILAIHFRENWSWKYQRKLIPEN